MIIAGPNDTRFPLSWRGRWLVAGEKSSRIRVTVCCRLGHRHLQYAKDLQPRRVKPRPRGEGTMIECILPSGGSPRIDSIVGEDNRRS